MTTIIIFKIATGILSLLITYLIKPIFGDALVKDFRAKWYRNPQPPDFITSDRLFSGRVDEISQLNEGWGSGRINIISCVGWSGSGKSILLKKWYEDFAIEESNVFSYRFGPKKNIDDFADDFLNYFSYSQTEISAFVSTSLKFKQLKRHLSKTRNLILLDNLEIMQYVKSELQFGEIKDEDLKELILSFPKNGKSFMVITSQLHLKDLENAKFSGLHEIIKTDRLCDKDGLELVSKYIPSIEGEIRKKIIKLCQWHAYSIVLVSKLFIADDKFHYYDLLDNELLWIDETTDKKAKKILQWHDSLLDEEERIFLKLLSIFQYNISSDFFEKLYIAICKDEQIEVVDNNDYSRVKYVNIINRLLDRRLLFRNKFHFWLHPLTKQFFEKSIEPYVVTQYHSKAFDLLNGEENETPKILKDLEVSMDRVYHGCKAREYEKAFSEVYYKRITTPKQSFITMKLGAWDANYELIKLFYKSSNFQFLPLLDNRDHQNFIINETGLTLLNIGRLQDAKFFFKAKSDWNLKYADSKNAALNLYHLSGIQYRLGELDEALDHSESALNLIDTEKYQEVYCHVKARTAYINSLVGNLKRAKKLFEESESELDSIVKTYDLLRGIPVIKYADFLMKMKEVELAKQMAIRKLEICEKNKWIGEISGCKRNLGWIYRKLKNKTKANKLLNEALKMANNTGNPELIIRASLELSLLRIEQGKLQDAWKKIEYCESKIGELSIYKPQINLVKYRYYSHNKIMHKGKARECAELANKQSGEMNSYWSKKWAQGILN